MRHRERTRYIRTNNPNSSYAMHILYNQHKYASTPPPPLERTLRMFQPCHKGTFMNIWETLFIQQLHHQRLLINEQSPQETNPCTHWGTFRSRWPHLHKTYVRSLSVPSKTDINRWLSLLYTLPIPYVSNRYNNLILIPIYFCILRHDCWFNAFHVKNTLNMYYIWYLTTVTNHDYYYTS
jgi:hypothetical protein